VCASEGGVDIINLKDAGPELFNRIQATHSIGTAFPALETAGFVSTVWNVAIDAKQFMVLAGIAGSSITQLATLVDYHRDEIRAMTDNAAIRGRQFTPGGHWRSRGNIADRNQGMNYCVTGLTAGRTEYKQLDVNTKGCEIMRDGADDDYVWQILGQDKGVTITRYAPDHQVSKPVLGCFYQPNLQVWNVVMDPVTNELFWIRGSTGGPWIMQSAKKATLVAALAVTSASFTPDASASIEAGWGDGDGLAQRVHFVRHGTYIYRPGFSGIYRISWNNGSGDQGAWTLFYGKSGSGATHEILTNDYDVVTALSLHGTDDLLATTYKTTPVNRTVYAIDMTTNLLHETGVVDITSQLDTTPRSVAA
jgi:hypothetical protein